LEKGFIPVTVAEHWNSLPSCCSMGPKTSVETNAGILLALSTGFNLA